jgi:hypothetical protein
VAKQSRIQHKTKSVHRARKPRPVRPLDKPLADNHAARHEAAKICRAAHEALMAAQAAEKAAREAVTSVVEVNPYPVDLGPVEARLVEEVGR